MSRQLIESIISNNMLEANEMVEAKMAEIRERKMLEMKRMFAAKMDEAMCGMSSKKLKQPVDEGVADDVSRAVKRGVKRTKMRLKVMSYVPGEVKNIAAQGAKEAGKAAYDATLRGISDPLHTAGKAIGGAAKAVKATAGGVKKGLGAIAKSRLGQKIAAHEPEAPGTKVLRAAKRLSNSQISQDVKDIAFRNI